MNHVMNQIKYKGDWKMATADSYENDNTYSVAKHLSLNSIQYRSLTVGDTDWAGNGATASSSEVMAEG